MPGEIFLEGEKVNLRPIEKEDLGSLTKVNNPEIRKNLSSVSKPKNREQQKEFFQESISSDDDVHLAISDNEEMRGIISLIQEEQEVAKIGLWIDSDYHGKGFGTEASSLVVSYAFNQLNYHKVVARAVESNEGSRRVWNKLGFEKEGVFREHIYREGEFEDLLVYGVLQREWED